MPFPPAFFFSPTQTSFGLWRLAEEISLTLIFKTRFARTFSVPSPGVIDKRELIKFNFQKLGHTSNLRPCSVNRLQLDADMFSILILPKFPFPLQLLVSHKYQPYLPPTQRTFCRPPFLYASIIFRSSLCLYNSSFGPTSFRRMYFLYHRFA